MESKAKVMGHAAHPMLIVFPLGLFATAAVFDIIYLATGSAQWSTISFWLIAGGVVGGLIAAVPGLIDWMAIKEGTRAKSIGLIHGVGNVVIVVMFLISWFLRRDSGEGFEMAGAPGTLALLLSFGAVLFALFTGWLGGELIERLGISVHPGAHEDAPSSLSGSAAAERS